MIGKQELNVGNSCITVISSAKVTRCQKTISGHFLLLEQHDDTVDAFDFD